jgi:hypothetical protein
MLGDKPSLIDVARAIQNMEGWIPPKQNSEYPNGSRSWRNKNPGNIEYTGTTDGATASDGRFSIYPSYTVGFVALVQLLLRRKVEHPEWTLLDLFMSYAPPTENDTSVYAAFVAKFIDADITIKLEELC